MQPDIHAFFDEATFTVSYLVVSPEDRHAVIIDSVLDFDCKNGRTSSGSADMLLAKIAADNLQVDWILETHVHADHLTAADYLQQKTGAPIAIGAEVVRVQKTFAQLFNLGNDFACDGRQFDRLLADGARLDFGALSIEAWHTPGHTPACMMYLIGDAVFVGDTIFMPDYGSARCDFPGGDPAQLYRSLQRLLALPPPTRLFMCHDYGPGGRPFRWQASVSEQRADNIHIAAGTKEADFVAMRQARDAKLDTPALLLPAVQININAGRLPTAEANGMAYLKWPLNAL